LTMNSTVMTIFNQLIGQYSSSIAGLQSGSIILAKELFNAIALLSVGILGINHLLRKNVDMVDSNIELIRWLIYLNVFYLFITQYDQFLPLIIKSFQQAGAYLGGQAGGSYVVPTPASIINNGFAIAWKIFIIGLKQTLFVNLGITMVSVVVIVVILYCFGMIAIELLLLQIGSQIILAGGVFLLAFSGLAWTRDYAERYVHTFFQVGIKMLFMYVLVSIGSGLTNNWAQTLNNIPNNEIFQYQFAVVMATFVYYVLCQKLPEQATVYFTGRFPMGFNVVPSLPDVVKGAFHFGKQASELHTKSEANVQGYTKAYDAAKQSVVSNFQAQGKTASPQEIQQQTIKTLGEARQSIKQVEWNKVVDDTEGGKIAINIIDDIPPAEGDPGI
jgi:P-type conjugative transfer protein TrbL